MKHLAFAMVLVAAIPLLALDIAISNDFWCTWGYVNASPASSSMAFDAPFDSVQLSLGPYAPGAAETILCLTWTLHQSVVLRTFNSFPPKGVLLFLK